MHFEHDDHLHIMFTNSGNVSRKIDRSLRDCDKAVGDWHQAKMTNQIVYNPIKLPRYFKYRGELVVTGNDLVTLWNQCKTLASIRTNEDYYSVQLRTQTRANIDRKVHNRMDRYSVLHEELLRRSTKDF